MKIGSHVGMSGKDMLLGSAKEAVSYGADTFMFYTGAPQNTRRKEISELNTEPAWDYMKEHGIEEIIVHAPYIINLANTVKPETYELAERFLALELERTAACRSQVLILHPGSHVGAGVDAGIARRSFEELARIYDGVTCSDKLRVCFDTCHTSDSGYDIIHDFDGVIEKFDRLIGKDQIAVFHINDSKNPAGASKDRHANIGFGQIGFEALNYIVHHPDFQDVPKILETPYVPSPTQAKKSFAPYKYEIEMLRQKTFDPDLLEKIAGV